jgi:lysozyme
MQKKPTAIGQPGLDIIKLYESCRLHPYLCPSNYLTIGWGHLLVPKWDAALFGLPVEALKRIKTECESARRVTREAAKLFIYQEVADKLLDQDVKQTALFVHSVVRQPLNQNQFDALCSFVFNVGQNQFVDSTLRKKLNAGDYAGAAAQFPRWKYGTVNGVKTVLPGLVARRETEQALFTLPESP